jgi:septal ring factor EnvC (AmiA/AmiB activator)
MIPGATEAPTPESIRSERLRLQEARDRYEKARQRVVVLTGQYDELERERQANALVQEKLEGELAAIRTKVESVHAELVRLAGQRDEAASRFATSFRDFSRRLDALYEMRSYPLMGFVFRSQSFAEFMRRWEYARILASVDIRRLEEMSTLRGQMAATQASLEAEKQKMEALKEEKRRKNQALAQAIVKGQEILDQLRTERVSAVSRASSLSKYTRELEDKIRQLEARRVADLAQRGPGPVAGPGGEQLLATRSVAPGTFGWPLDGDMEVVRPFGRVRTRGEPEFNNPGIDVRIASLRTVKAVESGKVIHQGRLPSFGKVLMIDHGGRSDKVISVYGNLDSIMVGVGQWVKRGEPVALIGQGIGPRGAEAQLHLEIRKNTEPVDPLVWLER